MKWTIAPAALSVVLGVLAWQCRDIDLIIWLEPTRTHGIIECHADGTWIVDNLHITKPGAQLSELNDTITRIANAVCLRGFKDRI